jgi:hypothetical protein
MVLNPASAKVPGVLTYDNLTQHPSYDVQAFLRYEPKPLQYVAIGIEKSWGGKQIAINFLGRAGAGDLAKHLGSANPRG